MIDKEKEMLDTLNVIFQLFTEFNQKEFLGQYDNLNINDVHAIDFIGISEDANVTRITDYLKITKGAVTKITQKLIRKGIVVSYKKNDNKKEKYFRLEGSGKKIFDLHRENHLKSIQRDRKMFDEFDEKEKETIEKFLEILKGDLEDKLIRN